MQHLLHCNSFFRLKCQGFTLVEILVTLAILASLLMAVSQLTADWQHSAYTSEAKTKLNLGFETAKALALRNPCRVDGTQAAASLKAELKQGNIVLTVQAGDAASTPHSCDYLHTQPNPQWQVQILGGVALSINGVTLSPSHNENEMKLDSRSWPLQTQKFDYQLSKGQASNDEVGTLR